MERPKKGVAWTSQNPGLRILWIFRERLTPTFVLVHEGEEVGRLRGYPGDQFFWGLLGGMLERLPAQADASATLER